MIDTAVFTTVRVYRPDRHTVVFSPRKVWFPQIVHFPGPSRLDTVSPRFGLATSLHHLPKESLLRGVVAVATRHPHNYEGTVFRSDHVDI